MENDKGVSNILAGELQPWESLGDQTIDNLRVLPSGPVPAKPAELLGSERMGELIAGLREVADFVIIDTAPVLLVADAAALSPLVDAVLLVANAENSTRSARGARPRAFRAGGCPPHRCRPQQLRSDPGPGIHVPVPLRVRIPVSHVRRIRRVRLP